MTTIGLVRGKLVIPRGGEPVGEPRSYPGVGVGRRRFPTQGQSKRERNQPSRLVSPSLDTAHFDSHFTGGRYMHGLSLIYLPPRVPSSPNFTVKRPRFIVSRLLFRKRCSMFAALVATQGVSGLLGDHRVLPYLYPTINEEVDAATHCRCHRTPCVVQQ